MSLLRRNVSWFIIDESMMAFAANAFFAKNSRSWKHAHRSSPKLQTPAAAAINAENSLRSFTIKSQSVASRNLWWCGEQVGGCRTSREVCYLIQFRMWDLMIPHSAGCASQMTLKPNPVFELIAQSRKNFPSKLVKSSYLTEHQCHFVVFETRKHDGSDREHVIAGLCYLLTKKKGEKCQKCGSKRDQDEVG